jgi:glycosyltransferase involved in cell wall biosynthesis
VLHANARAAREAGYSPVFALLRPGEFEERLRRDGFVVHVHPDHRFRNINAVIHARRFVKELVARLNPILVHVNHAAWVYANHLKAEVIVHYHDLPNPKDLLELAHVIWRPRNVIFTTEVVEQGYPHLKNARSTVIPPIVLELPHLTARLPCFQYSTPSTAFFLTVCRMQEHKGLADLLAACALVKDICSVFRFVIVGSASDERQRRFLRSLERFAHANDLGRIVEFRGSVTDEELDRLYCSAYALIHPARTEGFGLVLLEAMRRGLPIIATRAVGPSMIVKDLVSGLLTEPQNPLDLASAIRRVAADPTLRNELALGASRRARDFNALDSAQKTLDFYRNIINGGAE